MKEGYTHGRLEKDYNFRLGIDAVLALEPVLKRTTRNL
jgi:hypothetical protein